MEARNWKIAAIVAALIPIMVLLIVALRGGASGLGSYGELLPIALLAIYGWYAPRSAGFVLLFGAIALMLMYAISSIGTAPLSAVSLVELVVFAPLIVSGACFLKSNSQ